MAVTKAHIKATNKYNAKAYDSLRIVVKKGRKKDIQTHAAKRGESINAFVGRAIDETMARDMGAKVEKIAPRGEVSKGV